MGAVAVSIWVSVLVGHRGGGSRWLSPNMDRGFEAAPLIRNLLMEKDATATENFGAANDASQETCIVVLQLSGVHYQSSQLR